MQSAWPERSLMAESWEEKYEWRWLKLCIGSDEMLGPSTPGTSLVFSASVLQEHDLGSISHNNYFTMLHDCLRILSSKHRCADWEEL